MQSSLPKPHASLALVSPQHGQPLRIFDGMVVGRTQGGVRFPLDPEISDPHLRLFLDPQTGVFYCEDLGSQTGTFINGLELEHRQPVPLRAGDSLEFGKQVFSVRESGIVRQARIGF